MGQILSLKRFQRGKLDTNAETTSETHESQTPEAPNSPDQSSSGTTVSVFCDTRHKDPFSTLTHEKKYINFAGSPEPYPVFIKRSLTPNEYVHYNSRITIIPYMIPERMKNEVASIKFIKENTTIPVPNVHCAFEDHGRHFIITDIVPGVLMADLPEDKKKIVIEELQGYIQQMHALKSKIVGGILGDVIIPYRLIKHVEPEIFHNLRQAETAEYSFCHQDLSQFNIIVNEETLRINAIIDWEYAGFFPPEFDSPFYTRKGKSVAIGDELDDTPKLLEFLNGLAGTD